MRHISVFGNNLQPLDSLSISHDIVKEDGAVFLDPVRC